MGVRLRGLSRDHLLPVPGNKRVLLLHHRLHRGALHRHLPPHQSAVPVHLIQGEEDHHAGVDAHLCLLRDVALSVGHQEVGVRQRGAAQLRVQGVQEPLPAHLLHGFCGVLRAAPLAGHHSVRTDRPDTFPQSAAFEPQRQLQDMEEGDGEPGRKNDQQRLLQQRHGVLPQTGNGKKPPPSTHSRNSKIDALN